MCYFPKNFPHSILQRRHVFKHDKDFMIISIPVGHPPEIVSYTAEIETCLEKLMNCHIQNNCVWRCFQSKWFRWHHFSGNDLFEHFRGHQSHTFISPYLLAFNHQHLNVMWIDEVCSQATNFNTLLHFVAGMRKAKQKWVTQSPQCLCVWDNQL